MFPIMIQSFYPGPPNLVHNPKLIRLFKLTKRVFFAFSLSDLRTWKARLDDGSEVAMAPLFKLIAYLVL